MSAATTVNVASAAIPENKTKKVSPSLIAVYVVLVVLAVVWLLPVIYTVYDFVQVGGRIHLQRVQLPAREVGA